MIFFTGVAVAVVAHNEKMSKLEEIKVIENWGKNMSNTLKVPSAYSYSQTTTEEEQWGSSISSNATVMVHTKLELDEQDCKNDELDIILHNLDGMGDLSFAHVERTNGRPEFSPKKPDDIVQDYLVKVFDRVMAYIEKDLGFEEVDRRGMPVDIVFTVPVVSNSLIVLCLYGLIITELVVPSQKCNISRYYKCWVQLKDFPQVARYHDFIRARSCCCLHGSIFEREKSSHEISEGL